MYRYGGSVARHTIDALVPLIDTLDVAAGSEGFRATVFEPTRDRFYPLLASAFPGRWTYCILVALYPKRMIAAHIDGPCDGIRHHLVLETNEECWSFSDGTWGQLQRGSFYQMDPNRPHGAVNWGTSRRVHLVIDTKD